MRLSAPTRLAGQAISFCAIEDADDAVAKPEMLELRPLRLSEWWMFGKLEVCPWLFVSVYAFSRSVCYVRSYFHVFSQFHAYSVVLSK